MQQNRAYWAGGVVGGVGRPVLLLRHRGHGERVRVEVRHHGVHDDGTGRVHTLVVPRRRLPVKHAAPPRIGRPPQERQQPRACVSQEMQVWSTVVAVKKLLVFICHGQRCCPQA